MRAQARRITARSCWLHRMVRRFRSNWKWLRCTAKLLDVSFKGGTGAGKITPTRSLGVSLPGLDEGWGILCTRRKIDCDSCPRLKAMRQSLAAGKTPVRHTKAPLVSAPSSKTNLGNGNGKITAIDNLDAQAGIAGIEKVSRRTDEKTNAVSVEAAPCVENAKDSADARDPKGNLVLRSHRCEEAA